MKKFLRSAQAVKQKAGVVQGTTDDAYDELEKEIHRLQKTSRELPKVIAGLHGGLKEFWRAHGRMSSEMVKVVSSLDLSTLSSDMAQALDSTSHAFEGSELDKLTQDLNSSAVEVLRKLEADIKSLEHIRNERAKRRLDYDMVKEKTAKKEAELLKKGKDVESEMKWRRIDVETALKAYEVSNSRCIEEMTKVASVKDDVLKMTSYNIAVFMGEYMKAAGERLLGVKHMYEVSQHSEYGCEGSNPGENPEKPADAEQRPGRRSPASEASPVLPPAAAHPGAAADKDAGSADAKLAAADAPLTGLQSSPTGPSSVTFSTASPSPPPPPGGAAGAGAAAREPSSPTHPAALFHLPPALTSNPAAAVQPTTPPVPAVGVMAYRSSVSVESGTTPPKHVKAAMKKMEERAVAKLQAEEDAGVARADGEAAMKAKGEAEAEAARQKEKEEAASRQRLAAEAQASSAGEEEAKRAAEEEAARHRAAELDAARQRAEAETAAEAHGAESAKHAAREQSALQAVEAAAAQQQAAQQQLEAAQAQPPAAAAVPDGQEQVPADEPSHTQQAVHVDAAASQPQVPSGLPAPVEPEAEPPAADPQAAVPPPAEVATDAPAAVPPSAEVPADPPAAV
ncbi:hypothetical protein DIPPA_06089 [Diplonema papillatum]|nr:hypothetical protein DIPPA_06089 [Diplonema papillatum]